MVQRAAPSLVRDLHDLLDSLLELAGQSHDIIGSMAGTFRAGSARHGIPRFMFAGPPAAHEPIRLGLFAGLHGDEPAGCEALVRFLCDLAESPADAAGYDLIVYPICNPTGYEDNTRHNFSGRDLNREFWRDSLQPEVRILERELRAHRFDGLITLHADDTSDGVYGYTHGRVLNEALLRPALDAGARHLPRDTRPHIDGFTAAEGMICECFKGVLAAPPEQTPRPFDVIFETPALAPLPLQVEASVAALHSILAQYRRFIAYGQYL
jgi:hypothetical protein